MFSHMLKNTDNDKRCIYAYEFIDNNVYVGLTKNIITRNRQHMKKGSVYEYKKICNNYKFLQLTDYLDIETASMKEGDFVEKYKNDGWKILNKIKTGGIGSNGNKQKILYWTKEKCQEESLKYLCRSEFKIKSASAYQSALKNKWLNDICLHMSLLHKPNNYWTKEKCQEEALKYNNRYEFQKKSSGAFSRSYINGWYDEICSHMSMLKIKYDSYSKNECKVESLKYKGRYDFFIKNNKLYNVSLKNGWLDDFFPKDF